jgi:hypothetical protein
MPSTLTALHRKRTCQIKTASVAQMQLPPHSVEEGESMRND